MTSIKSSNPIPGVSFVPNAEGTLAETDTGLIIPPNTSMPTLAQAALPKFSAEADAEIILTSARLDPLYLEASSRSVVTHVPLSVLTVDSKLQRLTLRTSDVDGIVKNFDKDALGVLEVSNRISGMHHVLDGYHRLTALRILRAAGRLPADYAVLCKVFVGLTTKEEARLFDLLNTRRSVGPVDLFRVRLEAGDAQALDIQRVLTANGWTIDKSGNVGSFSALASAKWAHSKSPIGFEKAVNTLTRAWMQRDSSNLAGEAIKGLTWVYSYYGDRVNVAWMATALGEKAPNGSTLMESGRMHRGTNGGTTANGVAFRVVNWYNRHRATKSLGEWPKNGKAPREGSARNGQDSAND